MLYKIRANPMHTTLGVGFIGIGMYLMQHDDYFKWPPHLRDWANSDLFGAWIMLLGMAFLIWVVAGGRSVRWNRFIIVASAATLGFLAVYQLLHAIATGQDNMPWISNAVITVQILILARGSNTRDD